MRNFKLEDFTGSGKYLLRMSPEELHARDNNKSFRGYSDTGYLSTIVSKVGYIINNHGIGGNNHTIVTLTDMSDGFTIISNYTNKDAKANNYEQIIWQGDDINQGKQLFIDWLNNPELSQEYRFATQEEITRVVMYQSSRWRN